MVTKVDIFGPKVSNWFVFMGKICENRNTYIVGWSNFHRFLRTFRGKWVIFWQHNCRFGIRGQNSLCGKCMLKICENRSTLTFSTCMRAWRASLADIKKMRSSASIRFEQTLSSLTRNLMARSICWERTSVCMSSPANASDRLCTMNMLGFDNRSETLWKNFWKVFNM